MASCEKKVEEAEAAPRLAAAAAAAGPPCAGKAAAAAAAAGSVPWWRPCANPGNPVFSCMLDAQALPSRPPLSQKPPQPLLFRTTSSDYGAVPPTSPMVPCRHCPRENAFTNHLFACGLTQFNGINTGLDRDRPCDPAELLNVL